MACHVFALCFDANDPPRLARFWAGLLGWDNADDLEDGMALLPTDDTGFGFRFRPTREQKTGQNPTHFHLTSTSLEDQQQTVARSLGLGARLIDVGQRPEEGHVVLADPEGNEFCVIEPGNNYLAGCGFFAEITCEGSPHVGYFWSEALGVATGLGSGPGDRDTLAARRPEDQLGRQAGQAADRKELASSRPRSPHRW
jgi:predicted enzyme related to lactoylglutathione lyase